MGAKRIGPVPNKRITFVIDTDATVLGVIKNEFSFESHADEALEIVRAAKS